MTNLNSTFRVVHFFHTHPCGLDHLCSDCSHSSSKGHTGNWNLPRISLSSRARRTTCSQARAAQVRINSRKSHLSWSRACKGRMTRYQGPQIKMELSLKDRAGAEALSAHWQSLWEVLPPPLVLLGLSRRKILSSRSHWLPRLQHTHRELNKTPFQTTEELWLQST